MKLFWVSLLGFGAATTPGNHQGGTIRPLGERAFPLGGRCDDPGPGTLAKILSHWTQKMNYYNNQIPITMQNANVKCKRNLQWDGTGWMIILVFIITDNNYNNNDEHALTWDPESSTKKMWAWPMKHGYRYYDSIINHYMYYALFCVRLQAHT